MSTGDFMLTGTREAALVLIENGLEIVRAKKSDGVDDFYRYARQFIDLYNPLIRYIDKTEAESLWNEYLKIVGSGNGNH